MFDTYITEHCMKQVLLDNGWIVINRGYGSWTNCPQSVYNKMLRELA